MRTHVADSPFGEVLDPPILLGLRATGLRNVLTAGFIRHVPTVVLPAALQSSGDAAT